MKEHKLNPKNVSEILKNKNNHNLCIERINKYFGPFKTRTDSKTKDGWTGSFFEKYSENADQEYFDGQRSSKYQTRHSRQ